MLRHVARPAAKVPRLIASTPPELIVHDRPQRCPYLGDRVARMPLRLPARALTPGELDRRLVEGDRRQGFVLYRTACPACTACEPIRIDTQSFTPSRSHRRILARGDRLLDIATSEPTADAERVALYNKHKVGRGLFDGQPPMDLDSYRDFLVCTCCDSFELCYYLGGRLIGVAIVDRGANSLSAVYCHYDPTYGHLSLGTYSILKQYELCRALGLRYLYLGLYIASCDRMRYKARFLPHERLVEGRWVRFER
jgi:arginine-tRNA-protein transferase